PAHGPRVRGGTGAPTPVAHPGGCSRNPRQERQIAQVLCGFGTGADERCGSHCSFRSCTLLSRKRTAKTGTAIAFRSSPVGFPHRAVVLWDEKVAKNQPWLVRGEPVMSTEIVLTI